MPRFLSQTLENLLGALETSLETDDFARKRGLLQSLDARAKIIGVLTLVLSSCLSKHLEPIAATFVLAVVLAWVSGVSPRKLATREWLPVLVFTSAIALPALFLTPGPKIEVAGVFLSQSGLQSAVFLLFRAETAATLALLLVLSTPQNALLRGFRSLGVPALLVVILSLTHRYLFLLLQQAQNIWEARRARLVGTLSPAQNRQIAASSAGVLLLKSLDTSNEVYAAMLARGFNGEFPVLEEPRLQKRDWAAISGVLVLASVLIVWGWK